MKRFFSLSAVLLLFFLMISDVFAQEQTPKKHKQSSVGLFAGINRGAPDTDPEIYSTDAKTGYEFGLFLRSGKWLYIQSGLTYLTLSQEFTPGSSNTDPRSGKLNFNRLELPVYAGLNLLPIGHKIFNIRGFAGPTFIYTLRVDDNEIGINNDDIHRFQLDVGAGVGVDILFIKVDLGFSYGMVNLISEVKSHATYGFITLGLGI